MASSGGGGASVQSSSGKPEEKTKELPASNVFTAMISRSLKEESGTLVLQKGNTTELGVVATDTAKALGDTVSRAFGLPSKKNLLLTLGLCGVDLNLKMTRAFVTKDYKAADVLAITTGSHVALWQIIRDYRDVCDKLDRAAVPDASQADPSLAAWVDLKDAVFTISKPTALKKPTRTTIRRQLKPLPELKPEGVPAPRRGEEGEGEMPADEGKKDEEEWETCWIVQPDTNRALYRFLLSLHLRGRGEQRGHAGLIPPGPDQVLAWTIPPEAYLYLRRLHEKLSSPDKDSKFLEDATAEQKLLDKHRNQLAAQAAQEAQAAQAARAADVQAPQGAGGACDGSHCDDGVPLALFPAPTQAPPPAPYPTPAPTFTPLDPDTPVVKHMLSDAHRDWDLRTWEGVYGLHAVLYDGRLVYVRHYDFFERLPNDGDMYFSRLGLPEDLPPDFAGHCQLSLTGQRPGRMAVEHETSAPFAHMLYKRDCERLVFDQTGMQLLGMLDGEGGVIPLDHTDRTHRDLHAELTKPENQVLLRDMVSGWVMDFHHKAATRSFPPPPPPSDDSTDSASLVSDMSLGQSGAEETIDHQERRSKRKAGDSVEAVSHNNRLTSGDMAALLMVEYLWSGQHANHVAPSLLSPTSVTWALPRSVLNRAFRATMLSSHVYDCLLRPPWLNGGLEFFFLQDLITFVNGCGWAGKLQQDARSFLDTHWSALLRLAPTAAMSLPAARFQPGTTTNTPLAYVTMSSTEHMALSLHYYGVGGRDEQHARIDYRPTPQALLVDLPDDMKDQMRTQDVDPEDLAQVIQFLRTEQPATQAVVQQGATRTSDNKYHFKQRSRASRASKGYTAAVGR